MNGGQVERVHNAQNFFHQPAYAPVFVLVQLVQKIDQLTQQGKIRRDMALGVFQRDRGHLPGVELGQEQPVTQSLGEGVGKLLERQVLGTPLP